MTNILVVSALRNISLGFIVAGILFTANSFSHLAGFVILNAMSALNSFVWGGACIIAGILLSVMGRSGKIRLEKAH